MKRSKLKITLELLHDFLLLPEDCTVRGCSVTDDGRDCEVVLESEDSSDMPQSDNLGAFYRRNERGTPEFASWQDAARKIVNQDRLGREML